MTPFDRRQFLAGMSAVAAGTAFWDVGASYRRAENSQIWWPPAGHVLIWAGHVLIWDDDKAEWCAHPIESARSLVRGVTHDRDTASWLPEHKAFWFPYR